MPDDLNSQNLKKLDGITSEMAPKTSQFNKDMKSPASTGMVNLEGPKTEVFDGQKKTNQIQYKYFEFKFKEEDKHIENEALNFLPVSNHSSQDINRHSIISKISKKENVPSQIYQSIESLPVSKNTT